MIRRSSPKPVRLQSGPWKGVRNTRDIDENVLVSEYLADALNLYCPDPAGGSGFYLRPGYSLLNGGSAVHTGGATFRGQGGFSHIALDGTAYNFVVFEGKLYRVTTTLLGMEDVTPVGVTISSTWSDRVYGTSFANQLAVTDGVNRPWLATNLSSTPITGTYIDFDGSGTAWAAQGPGVPWGGSVFWILKSYNAVAAQTDIAWSESGDASVGYQQSGYDNRWTLLQTATDALYALAPTNLALNYFRARSIGAIGGTVGPDLASTATHDAISVNVGCTMPQSVFIFGTTVYFTDAVGRPYRLPQGGTPEAIWLQLRTVVDESSAGFPGTTRQVCTAGFDPNLNVYLVAPWSSLASVSRQPTQMQAFNAKTGVYVGPWQIADGAQIDAMCTFVDSTSRAVLITLGSAVAPSGSDLATSGFLWALNGLAAEGDILTTEDGLQLITLEDDATYLATEGTESNWLDNGEVPEAYAITARLGYDHERTLTADRVTALVGSTSPVEISASTSGVEMTLQATATPTVVQDGVPKAVVGCDGIQGRGIQVKVKPTEADSQWHLQHVAVDALVGVGSPDEA